MKFIKTALDFILRLVSLFVVAVVLVFIPLKVLSYGWSPNFGMMVAATLIKGSSIPISPEVIVDSIKSLSLLYPNAVEYTLINYVTALFVLFNIAGLCYATKHIAWFCALALIMLYDDTFVIQLLSGSPLLLLCMVILISLASYGKLLKTRPKTSFLFIAAMVAIIRFVATPEIYAFTTVNMQYKEVWSLTFIEFLPIALKNCWLIFMPMILWLCARKCLDKEERQLNNPLLLSTLILQLLVNIGYFDLELIKDTLLAAWLTDRFSVIIEGSKCFENLRVKYLLGAFVIVAFAFLSIHDGKGRYSRSALDNFPVDFGMEALKDWAPGESGIIYNDNQDFAFAQYYAEASSKKQYYFFNGFTIPSAERNNIIKIQSMLRQKKTPLPDYYETWVEQMSPSDRLMTSAKINGLENLDWLQLGRFKWIAKLKTER